MHRWINTSLYLYMIVDVAITNLSFGYFAPGWKFHTDLFVNITTFSLPYHFTTSPLEFQIFLFIRQTFCAIAVLLIILGKKEKTKHLLPIVTFNAVITYCFSLVKFLAFSEDYEQLYYPGVWFSVVWAILSGALQVLVWYFVLSSQSFDYHRLLSTTADSEDVPSPETAADSTSDTPSNSNVESGATSPATPRTPLRQVLRQLFSYCGHQWPWFVAGFFFLIIYAVARVFIPNYTAQVISDIVNRGGTAVLLHSIFILGILTATSSFFGGLRGGCFDYATALVALRIRLDLFTSLINQDIGFFDTSKTGETMSRLTSDCQTIASTVSTNVNVFMRNGVMLIGAVVFMFVMSWRLAMVTFIAVPFVGFITKVYGKFYDKISEKLQQTIADANQMAEEVLSTMRTVRSFACEKREKTRFENLLSSTLSVNRKRALAYMGYTWNNEFCNNAILIAVLWYGGHLVLNDKMKKEQLITFLLYQMQLGENLYMLSYVMSGLMEAVGASRKVFELVNRKPQFELNGRLKPTVNGNITFSHVGFTYPSRPNNPVLKDLTLSIKAGETVALVGPSGGGKSSIVSLIEHFYEPNDGTVSLDGVQIKDINHIYYHQKIALVAQEPILYNGSVRHNILYGCDFATEDDMLNASKMANVHDFVMELEKGYDTNCGEKGVQMSGGQKQRIAIARALVRNPAVLILDEATSALDTESEALVQQALSRCAQERTVIIIAHRLSTIEKASKIAVIVKGHLVQMGTHSELMSETDGTYYSLVSRQMLSAKVGDE
ncbi:CRE-HAF-2 protein [Caenorhabditis remanei]|uniref:ABC-type antigen peptide transporter n=1 Tax=Caenorhabditis remanei TaxID=31234 RepID=E3LQD7_CAERE|nr:CRE-HAF-2 protein [Caenorhabditis remanei]